MRISDWSSDLCSSDLSASRGSAEAVCVHRLGDIVVTCRRREENAHTVPVSVTAFSGAALEQRNVHELQDLNLITPGLRFSAEGGKTTTTVILRGLGRNPIGEGVPAVVTYFADIPLVGEGTNVPAYDIASIQVLKGPQGTRSEEHPSELQSLMRLSYTVFC